VSSLDVRSNLALSLALELISLSLISWQTSLGRHASERASVKLAVRLI